MRPFVLQYVLLHQMYVLDQLATHVAYIISEAVNASSGVKESENAKRVALEPSHEAETG